MCSSNHLLEQTRNKQQNIIPLEFHCYLWGKKAHGSSFQVHTITHRHTRGHLHYMNPPSIRVQSLTTSINYIGQEHAKKNYNGDKEHHHILCARHSMSTCLMKVPRDKSKVPGINRHTFRTSRKPQPSMEHQSARAREARRPSAMIKGNTCRDWRFPDRSPCPRRICPSTAFSSTQPHTLSTTMSTTSPVNYCDPPC